MNFDLEAYKKMSFENNKNFQFYNTSLTSKLKIR